MSQNSTLLPPVIHLSSLNEILYTNFAWSLCHSYVICKKNYLNKTCVSQKYITTKNFRTHSDRHWSCYDLRSSYHHGCYYWLLELKGNNVVWSSYMMFIVNFTAICQLIQKLLWNRDSSQNNESSLAWNLVYNHSDKYDLLSIHPKKEYTTSYTSDFISLISACISLCMSFCLTYVILYALPKTNFNHEIPGSQGSGHEAM
jgi:hypothetical protein